MTAPAPRPAWQAWLLYLTMLLRPSLTMGFLWFSARVAHGAAGSLLWLGTVGLTVGLDQLSGRERRAPASGNPRWFAGHVYLLFACQVAVFAAWLATMRQPQPTVDLIVATLLVGVNSGYASLILAHELIHRGRGHQRLMGRALLVSCLYEHWFTEHLRAHHANFAMRSDAGTARAGESYWRFCRRSVPGQLASAWSREAVRVGARGWFDQRWLRSRVLRGLLTELALLVGMGLWGGPLAVAALIGQAAIAVLLLEAVDYFTHYGLDRDDGERSVAWSWDCESRLTMYSLLGLARHADHHLHPGRPFHQLQPHAGSLKLPYGYPLMVLLAMFANRRFQRLLTAASQLIDHPSSSESLAASNLARGPAPMVGATPGTGAVA